MEIPIPLEAKDPCFWPFFGNSVIVATLAVTCAVVPTEIELTDTLSIDGEARTIKKIVQLPAAGVAVTFKLFVQG